MLKFTNYHHKVLEYFKQHKKTWDFFASSKTRQEQVIQYKSELLKNTYKFDPATDAQLYEKVQKAKDKLQLETLNVYLYQAQYADEINASIVFLENEAHIVFSGAVTQILDDDEMLAVLAHELSHIKLYLMQNVEFEIAHRLVTAIANNQDGDAAYYETARLFRLYTEIFCDRGAYMVLEDPGPVISSLVKVATGLKQVSAESYVKQAEEIFASGKGIKAATNTHPENFIRARAIQLWHTKKEESEQEIVQMIEGLSDLTSLDIFKQQGLSEQTRKLLQLYLKPNWFRSTLVISQARQFFPDFSFSENVKLDEDFRESVQKAHENIKNYFSYVLLDFAVVDSGLEAVPFGWAFQFAEDLGLKDCFDMIVKKELKLSDKKLQQHKLKALESYYAVKEGEGEQIYEG